MGTLCLCHAHYSINSQRPPKLYNFTPTIQLPRDVSGAPPRYFAQERRYLEIINVHDSIKINLFEVESYFEIG